jgi:hypothetical protein
MTKLIAYHNDPKVKTAIIAQLKAHHKADEFVKGFYWEDGKGCAVGCTLHSGRHAEYEPRFGIPQMLARLEDCIFEGLSNGKAKDWPIKFMSAIKPGTDLSLVGWKFLYWLLTDKKVNPGIEHPLVKDAVKQCADMLVSLTEGKLIDKNAAWAAYDAANAAANDAAYANAACVAAYAADAAYAAAYAAAAADAAANAATNAAAYDAADAAARAASAADAAYAYSLMAKKLLTLLNAAPLHSNRKSA